MVRENLISKPRKRMPGRGTFIVAFLICVGVAGHGRVYSDELPQIVIAPEPVGSGARALGQSAFIAVADDATAASWNPAGLTNLERPEASFVGAWRSTTYDYSPAGDRVSTGPASWDEGQVNFMSYAHPLTIDSRDVVLSVNYHQVYDFGLALDYTFVGDGSTVSANAKGAISAYSLAGGFSLSSHHRLTLGASFNWYTQSLLYDFAWQTRLVWRSLERTDTFDDFRGYNFTLGLLWDVYERQENLMTLGLVFHTPFTAEVHRQRQDRQSQPYYRWPEVPMDFDMDFPLALGAGVNYRFSDRSSLAFDVDWKQWSRFKQTDVNDVESRPIGEGEGDIADTLAFRLGGEHLWFSRPGGQSVYALRGGIFYEPRPALDDPMAVYGFSVGAGWTLKERFSLDFAYQYRWGEEIGGRNLGQGVSDVNYSIREHFLVGSVIVYF